MRRDSVEGRPVWLYHTSREILNDRHGGLNASNEAYAPSSSDLASLSDTRSECSSRYASRQTEDGSAVVFLSLGVIAISVIGLCAFYIYSNDFKSLGKLSAALSSAAAGVQDGEFRTKSGDSSPLGTGKAAAGSAGGSSTVLHVEDGSTISAKEMASVNNGTRVGGRRRTYQEPLQTGRHTRRNRSGTSTENGGVSQKYRTSTKGVSKKTQPSRKGFTTTVDPEVHTTDSDTETQIGVRPTARPKILCVSQACRKESDYLASFLNWYVKPCRNFYGFVCSHWKSMHPTIGASVDALRVQRLEEDVYHAFTSTQTFPPAILKIKRLLEACAQKHSHEDYQLTIRSVLSNVGLHGWPFVDDTMTVSDVWKVASLLIRRLGLATLVSVAVEADPETTNRHIISLGEPSLLIGQYDKTESRLPEWYSTVVMACLRAFANGGNVGAAEAISALTARLAEISSGSGYGPSALGRYKIFQLEDYNSLRELLELVFQNITSIKDNTKVLTRSDLYLKSLRLVMHVSRPIDMLNYMGFRALMHLSPLLSENVMEMASIQMKEMTGIILPTWPKWRRCLRMFERVRPAIFLNAYAQKDKTSSNTTAVRILMDEIKQGFASSLNRVSWLSIEDKAMLTRRAAKIKIDFFRKPWKNSGNDSVLLSTEVNGIITAYMTLATGLISDKLSKVKEPRRTKNREWKGSVFDTKPTYSLGSGTIFVPASILDPDYFVDNLTMALQVPRIVRKIIHALFVAVHAKNFTWTVDTERGYSDLQKCLQRHYRDTYREKDRMSELTTLDMMSLLPTHDIFMSHFFGKTNRGNFGDYDILSKNNITVDQLFFVLYAEGFCETGEAEKENRVMQDDAGHLRVNIPLRNSLHFQKTWDCDSKYSKNPRKKCSVWSK
ncbi:neprilysin-1-like [Ornithodoros turicata]|uniref:neprilysin-1-like n=1 Tax=Ornithodoros turicata TaxID=34597 RepID=UPI00313893FF